MFRFPCSYSAAAAFLAVVLLTKPADAQIDPRSANYFLPACQKFPNPNNDARLAFQMGLCAGIIEGLNHMDEKSCTRKA
jgi:hypothetical protein